MVTNVTKKQHKMKNVDWNNAQCLSTRDKNEQNSANENSVFSVSFPCQHYKQRVYFPVYNLLIELVYCPNFDLGQPFHS